MYLYTQNTTFWGHIFILGVRFRLCFLYQQKIIHLQLLNK
ncbi:hypothetical protein AsAng_0062690 [Aureispira anguillae]|uniref:Uncharacterized protein n=1 Tax=Aureispira anguillae TaxID=2864201 RepID=A0A915YLL0_9BACT|nr:hypothetical protein AsAng_0062690 [Aureispira anguillae]